MTTPPALNLDNILSFSAKALQTILVLTGPQGLYTRWADNAKDIRTEWSIDSARQVLETWQREFTKVTCSHIDKSCTQSARTNIRLERACYGGSCESPV